MAIYNLTNVTNSTNLYEYAVNLNNVGTSLYINYVTIFVIAAYIIILFSLKGWANREAFAASSFLFSLISLALWTAGLIADIILYIFLVLTSLGFVLLIVRGQN